MYTQAHGSQVWPSEAQRLLLQAAAFDGDRALHAWREWRAHHDLDIADPGTRLIFPPLYLNLKRLAPEDPDLPRLREAYQRGAAQTQRVLRTAAKVLRIIH